jgi:hypothetical protein
MIGSILPCSHCGRDWLAARPPRSSGWRICLLLFLCAASVVGFVWVCFGSHDSGSSDEADRLRAVVESIASPEAGQRIDPDYVAQRLPSGEWVLGIGRNSHAFPARFVDGTIVIKDSRGQVRCFFGYVCGPASLRLTFSDTESLDDLYKRLTNDYKYTEYHWP